MTVHRKCKTNKTQFRLLVLRLKMSIKNYGRTIRCLYYLLDPTKSIRQFIQVTYEEKKAMHRRERISKAKKKITMILPNIFNLRWYLCSKLENMKKNTEKTYRTDK